MLVNKYDAKKITKIMEKDNEMISEFVEFDDFKYKWS